MHSIGISVRRATISDIPAILAILANPEREFRATESPEDHYDQEDLVEWIESDKSLVLLAESDGELAGMSLSAAMARSWFMLETFYILPDHRRGYWFSSTEEYPRRNEGARQHIRLLSHS